MIVQSVSDAGPLIDTGPPIVTVNGWLETSPYESVSVTLKI